MWTSLPLGMDQCTATRDNCMTSRGSFSDNWWINKCDLIKYWENNYLRVFNQGWWVVERASHSIFGVLHETSCIVYTCTFSISYLKCKWTENTLTKTPCSSVYFSVCNCSYILMYKLRIWSYYTLSDIFQNPMSNYNLNFSIFIFQPSVCYQEHLFMYTV